ncbi:MAG TPA: DUF4118 domain-containing protein [Kouleothrix sp.]|uniref:DUF4118 domain-containing protein n=1 Tax=Kouleothrix sp. TaxID=2779161 RepID=UPI002CEF95EA|nr:DUF4118 domain-containing protein [Kouleothrix sp.]HRC75170.1 DUF4118 domain-containing protein [Kouleothrix sp.]
MTSDAPRTVQRLLIRYAYVWSVAIVVVVTAALWVIQHVLRFSLLSISPIYLVAVLLCAATLGRWPAMLCAGLSFVAFKFFFVDPIYSFTVDDAEDVSRLLVFLTTAFLAGGIALRVRAQATEAQQRADEAAALYALSQAISAELDFNTIAPLFVATAQRLLVSPGCRMLLVSDDGELKVCAESGAWPANAPIASAPLRSGNQTFGSIQIVSRPAQDTPVASQQRLLDTLANQAALALERSRLSQAAARAEALAASDRLKSTLLSAISHDFRTPLASIIGAAEELLSEDVRWSPTAIRDFAQVIDSQAHQLHHLVANLLDLTRIEAGVMHSQRGWYNMAEIIYSVLDRLASELAGRPIELVVADDLPLLPVDYVQIEQVLWNILQNARAYSPPGTPITITAGLEARELRIQIGDRGPGVAPEERARVFEKFYRASQPAGTRIPGTGIGLAICKGLIDAHGGRITLLGREGGGALVEIYLPIEASQRAVPVGV